MNEGQRGLGHAFAYRCDNCCSIHSIIVPLEHDDSILAVILSE